MVNRNRKLRRQLYEVIFWVIVWIGWVIFSIVLIIDSFFAIIFVGVGLWGLFGWLRKMRSILLDLREQPVEVEGVVYKKYFNDPPPDSSIYPIYLIYIDAVGFGLECVGREDSMVKEGDKVHAVYYQKTKLIESIDVLEKAV